MYSASHCQARFHRFLYIFEKRLPEQRKGGVVPPETNRRIAFLSSEFVTKEETAVITDH